MTCVNPTCWPVRFLQISLQKLGPVSSLFALLPTNTHGTSTRINDEPPDPTRLLVFIYFSYGGADSTISPSRRKRR